MDLTGENRERDVVERAHTRKDLCDAVNLQQGALIGHETSPSQPASQLAI
jgi:hypothetical protein